MKFILYRKLDGPPASDNLEPVRSYASFLAAAKDGFHRFGRGKYHVASGDYAPTREEQLLKTKSHPRRPWDKKRTNSFATREIRDLRRSIERSEEKEEL